MATATSCQPPCCALSQLSLSHIRAQGARNRENKKDMAKNVEEIKGIIIEALKQTFAELYKIYSEDKDSYATTQNTRLIFPLYRDKNDENYKGEDETDNPKGEGQEKRVSEQELRFVFVEMFTKLCQNKYYYSIETPTIGEYDFSDKENPRIAEKGKGQSGNFDLVIHDENKERVCLIEFKAHNVNQCYLEKDYVKLTNKEEGDDNVLRFFIQIAPSSNNGTVTNIKDKIEKINKKLKRDERHSITVTHICFSLSQNETILGEL